MSADEILPGLWMGSHPHVPLRVDVWALCARELQSAPRGTKAQLVKIPLQDDGRTLTRAQAQGAHRTARYLAKVVRGGGRALVTCAEGRNRSGLVTALTVMELTGMSGAQAVKLVKSRRRARALTNPTFVRYIQQL